MTFNFAGGSTTTVNVNSGRIWDDGNTHAVPLMLPTTPLRVSDITGVSISTQFGGGLSGDNWNVDKVALVVSFPAGSATNAPAPPIVHEWLDVSGGPLVRFTGDLHDYSVTVTPQDIGAEVSALNLVISTGNDDLRAGSNAGDNCDVTVELTSGQTIKLTNVNGGHNWHNWTDHTVIVPLPAGGLKGGDVKSLTLHTGFGGGSGGDNWNVNRLQLQAALAPVSTGTSCAECPTPPVCSASTDCTGILTISCAGPDVGVVFDGNCHRPDGEPVPCYAGFTGTSTVTAGGNVEWFGSTTSPNSAQSCTVNAIGETCIIVTTPVPPACPGSSSSAPLCGQGEKWCTKSTPARCTPILQCLVARNRPP